MLVFGPQLLFLGHTTGFELRNISERIQGIIWVLILNPNWLIVKYTSYPLYDHFCPSIIFLLAFVYLTVSFLYHLCTGFLLSNNVTLYHSKIENLVGIYWFRKPQNKEMFRDLAEFINIRYHLAVNSRCRLNPNWRKFIGRNDTVIKLNKKFI